MRKPRFTREELNCLEAGHEVEKNKYTYRNSLIWFALTYAHVGVIDDFAGLILYGADVV
jgi:hypothetical protein